MLQPPVGKTRSERRPERGGITVPRAERLHRIGRERGRTLEASVHHPRVAAVLSEVLPTHDDRAESRAPYDVVVDVLRGVCLVAGNERAQAEAEVLQEDRIDGYRSVARVRDVDAPNPGYLVPQSAQHDAMMQAAHLPFPGDTVLRRPEAHACARADGFARDSTRGTEPQQDTADAACDGRARHLIDEDARPVASMFDGVHLSVPKHRDA